MSSNSEYTEQGFHKSKYWDEKVQRIIDRLEIEQEREDIERELKGSIYSGDNKKSNRNVTDEIGEVVCSFLNTQGGVILVGIEEQNLEIHGIKIDLKHYGKKTDSENKKEEIYRDSIWRKIISGLQIGDRQGSGRELSDSLRIRIETVYDKKSKEHRRILRIDVRGKYLERDSVSLVHYKEKAYCRIKADSNPLKSTQLGSWLIKSEKERSVEKSISTIKRELEREEMSQEEREIREGKSPFEEFMDKLNLSKKQEYGLLVTSIILVIMVFSSSAINDLVFMPTASLQPILVPDEQDIEKQVEVEESVENRVEEPVENIVIEPLTTISILTIDSKYDTIKVGVSIVGEFDHWSIALQSLNENGNAGGIMVNSGYSHLWEDIEEGIYNVCVGAVDSSNKLIGEQDCQSVIVEFPKISIQEIIITKETGNIKISVFIDKEFDHWNVELGNSLNENGDAGGIMVNSGLTYVFSDTEPGSHNICVGVTNPSNKLLGEQVCKNIDLPVKELIWNVDENIKVEPVGIGRSHKFIISFRIENPNQIPITIIDAQSKISIQGFDLSLETISFEEDIFIEKKGYVIVKLETETIGFIEWGRLSFHQCSLGSCLLDVNCFSFEGTATLGTNIGTKYQQFNIN